MTDLLKTYEKNFIKINETIISNLNKLDLISNNNNSDTKEDIISQNKNPNLKKSNLLEETDKLLEEQIKILKQMEIEICSLMNRDDYEEFNTKILSFKKDLNINKKKFNEMYLKDESKNNSLNNTSENILLSERNNILINKEKYKFQQNEKILEVKRSLSNTENIGTNILVNMDTQTKGMKNISSKIKNMNIDLDDSNNVLNKMKKRTKKNKIIILLFCILFILILISVFGWKLYNKYKYK